MPPAQIVTVGDLVRLTFEVSGYERVSVGLSRFAQSLHDFRPFFRNVVAPWFFARVQENFAGQGAPVGGWAPLSPTYAVWKAKRYPGKPLLRRTDRLINSLTLSGAVISGAEAIGGRLGPGGVMNISEQAAELGTSVAYARHHQWGAPRAHLPQRRILYLPPDSSRTLGKLLHRWAVETLNSSHVTFTEQPTAIGGGLI